MELNTATCDGDGLRAEVASTRLASLNDGDQTVGELSFDEDNKGYENAFNGFGASGWEWRGLPNASSSSGVYIAFTYDPQGSLVQPVATYGSGTAAATVKVYSSSAYDGFGLAYTHAADTGTFDGTESGFGGQWGYYRESTTGQYLLGHRYYDPQRGRFITRDPLGYGGGINLYGFTGNNPVNNQDPSGFGPPARTPSEPGQEDAEDLAGDDPLMQTTIRNFRVGLGAREEEEGSTGEALALRTALNPRAERARVAGLLRELNRSLIQRLRSSAGFSNNGTPIIVDNSIGANPQATAAALRSNGYNARSVMEIFGRDPKDPAIRLLGEQLGGRVLASERNTSELEGFGKIKIPVSQKLRQPASVVQYFMKVFPK